MNKTILNLMDELDLKGAKETYVNLTSDVNFMDKASPDTLLQALLEAELTQRTIRRQQALLKVSRLPYSIVPSDFDFTNERDNEEFKTKINQLLSLNFIHMGQNLNVVGATGTGKTFLLCLLGRLACIDGKSTYYTTTHELINSIKLTKGSLSYNTRIKTISSKSVLILDDFCLFEHNEEEQAILFDILNNRFGKKTTMIGSQKTKAGWLEALGETALAESIVERASSNNYTIVLQGQSRRTSYS